MERERERDTDSHRPRERDRDRQRDKGEGSSVGEWLTLLSDVMGLGQPLKALQGGSTLLSALQREGINRSSLAVWPSMGPGPIVSFCPPMHLQLLLLSRG